MLFSCYANVDARAARSPCSTSARLSYVRRPFDSSRNAASRQVLMKGGIGDELADFIQAGPKLRKWYGETDKLYMPKDGGPMEPLEEEDEDGGPRDAILVTDADTPMGELVVLQLVLGRQHIRVLVKDGAKAKTEFGPYVEITQGTVNDGSALKKAMRNCRAVIIPGPVGQAARAAAALGLEHVVLLTTQPRGGILGGLFKGDDSAMEDPARAADVKACGLAHTILECGPILDRMGGNAYIEFTQAAGAAPGAIAREDAALVAVRAVSFPPAAGAGVTFTVGSAGTGVPPQGDEWSQMFGRLEAVVPVGAS